MKTTDFAEVVSAWPDRLVAEPPVFSFSTVQTPALVHLTASAGRPPAKLVVVTAPVGYGKTVLLSGIYDHVRATGGQALWLALDERDTTLDRLLTRLESVFSVERRQPDLIQAVHQASDALDERIARLVGELKKPDSTTLTLLVDNLNYCTDPALPRLLDALAFRTPATVHLVFSSTAVIGMNLPQALLQGFLIALDAADLSLDAVGVSELLGPALCARLSEEAIATIVRRTEGWPSAVRLMQIILSSAQHPESAVNAFSGTDQDLADLLNRQIFREFDPDFRQFLLKISLLRDFDVELAREAAGDARADEFIDRLWRRCLFLIPLDRNRVRYRLHTLFKEFLAGEASRRLPHGEKKDILVRAARCCEWQGRREDAISYALNGGAVAMAGTMLEEFAPTLVRDRGDLRRYLGWVEQLQSYGERGGWETDYWYVWALAYHHRYEFAQQQVARLLSRLRDERGEGLLPEQKFRLERRVSLIQIAIDVQTDRLSDALNHAGQWLALADQPSVRLADDPFDVTQVACAMAIHHAATCRFAEGRHQIRVALSHVEQSKNAHGAGWVAVSNALILLREGEYATAYREVGAAYEKACATLGEHAGVCSQLAALAAKAAIETGRSEEALAYLHRGVRKIRTHAIVDVVAHGLDAAIKLWGGPLGGEVSIDLLRDIVAAYPPRLALIFSCLLIRRLVRLGRIDEAEAEAVRLGLHGTGTATNFPEVMRDLLMATRSDLSIGQGRLKQAAELIAMETGCAREEGRAGRLVELSLDESALSLCADNVTRAMRHLSQAIALAARKMYYRPFLDRIELVAALVNRTRVKDWKFALAEEQAFFVELCRHLPTGNGLVADHLDEVTSSRGAGEAPTERELMLLSLIDAGLSNKQLADHLSMTVPTVKWHLYNLYAKLGVNSRASALARARSLNLLAR